MVVMIDALISISRICDSLRPDSDLFTVIRIIRPSDIAWRSWY